MKDYEVFNKLYPEVVAEYHRQACKQTELKGRDQIAAWQRNCKEAYLHASVEQKDAVEEKMKSEGDRTEDESSPQDYQQYVSGDRSFWFKCSQDLVFLIYCHEF